jgi:hypothetical protein
MDAAFAGQLALAGMQGVGRGQDDGFGPHAVQHLGCIGKPGGGAQIESPGVRHRICHRHQLAGVGGGHDGLDVPLSDQAGAQHGNAQWCHVSPQTARAAANSRRV